jgi:hypothetical protein
MGVFRGQKNTLFALYHVLMVFCICMSLAGSLFQNIKPSKKNRAEKPTVGFLFWAGSGNLVA